MGSTHQSFKRRGAKNKIKTHFSAPWYQPTAPVMLQNVWHFIVTTCRHAEKQSTNTLWQLYTIARFSAWDEDSAFQCIALPTFQFSVSVLFYCVWCLLCARAHCIMSCWWGGALLATNAKSRFNKWSIRNY